MNDAKTKHDGPRTAVVTGAAQGVGEAIARRLSSAGYERLVLIDRNEAALNEVATSLGAETLVLDLADVGAVRRQGRALAERLGAVHALVSAAGVTTRGGLEDIEPEAFDLLFHVNVRAPLFLMQALAPVMPRGSTIVSIASMLAHGGPPFLLAYAASKSALVTITKNAANTLKRAGVRVHAINLGWTVTPSEREVQTKLHGLPVDWVETLGPQQPFGRLLVPDDAADLTAFLVSDGAAMMTGTAIDLDQFVAGTVDDNPGNA